MPNLTVAEHQFEHLHHRPNRKLTSFATYEDRLSRGGTTDRIFAFAGNIRLVKGLWRNARFYRRMVPLVFEQQKGDISDDHSLPPPDGFRKLVGPGFYAHELLKRLEKEIFWDRMVLKAPVCEIGVHNGQASKYFFADRAIDFGSDYSIDELLKCRELPHRVVFSANCKFLPFPDSSVETLVCSQTVTVVYASVISLMAEANRVLRPGGRFIFTTHGPAYLRGLPLDGWPELGLSTQVCRKMNEQRANYMAHLYSREEWRQIMAATGFELESSRGILSLKHARYSQLFYFIENARQNPFQETCRWGAMGAAVRFLFGGRRRYEECESRYRSIMQRILAHEVAENPEAPFDHHTHLDAGLVAVKRSSVQPSIPRLHPNRVSGTSTPMAVPATGT